MTTRLRCFIVTVSYVCALCAQDTSVNQRQVESLPPATKMEAFKPTAGSVTTLGYDDLGKVASILVDVREMKSGNTSVRGLIVRIDRGEYQAAQSFVDEDEVPELLKGIDALMDVKSNPTMFRSFEIHYATRGNLRLAAFNNSSGDISFVAKVGRGSEQQCYLNVGQMQTLRTFVLNGSIKLAALKIGR